MGFNHDSLRSKSVEAAFNLSRLPDGTLGKSPHFFGTILYYWHATIYGHWMGSVTVGRAYAAWHSIYKKADLGLVLIDNPNYGREDLLGAVPIRSFDVTSIDDPVARALQNMNLFEEEIDVIPDRESKGIVVEIRHPNGVRELSGTSVAGETDPTWGRLRDALISSIEAFVPLYEDPLMSEYIRTQRKTQW